ncbi:MAG TPA: hypothetical protein VFR30_05415 [Lysobacter sp.]|nr:hypothetical protein [Lysobacter sp.]
MRKLMLTVSIILVCACKPAPSTSQRAQPASVEPAGAPAPAVAAADAPTGAAAFVDKVWRVQASTAVEPGSTYTFLADGTLVIDSPNGTPLQGSWNYDGGQLTMTEEGVAYPTDILKLDASTFQIRSNNPGGAVEITLVPAPDVPLPTVAK